MRLENYLQDRVERALAGQDAFRRSASFLMIPIRSVIRLTWDFGMQTSVYGKAIVGALLLMLFGYARAYPLIDFHEPTGMLTTLVNAYLFVFIVVGGFRILVWLGAGPRKRRELLAKYRGDADARAKLGAEAYAQAAAALRAFEPSRYEQACKRHSGLAVDILVMAQAIEIIGRDKRWRRLVSVRSIEQDREVTESDE